MLQLFCFVVFIYCFAFVCLVGWWYLRIQFVIVLFGSCSVCYVWCYAATFLLFGVLFGLECVSLYDFDCVCGWDFVVVLC